MGVTTPATAAAQFLERYADLLGLLALLPLLAHLKFGLILDTRSRIADESKPAKPSNEGEAKVAQDAALSKRTELMTAAKARLLNCVPPTSALVLLLAAEFCFATQLFNPSEAVVRKAMGDVMRSQEKNQSGIAGFLTSFENLIGKKEVYQLMRFLAATGGLAAMVANTTMRLHELDLAESFQAGGVKGIRQSIGRVFKVGINPRLWLAALLVASVVSGNYTALAKFMKRPIAVELLEALGGLLRAVAAGIAIHQSSMDGPLPVWCTVQSAAALARGAYIFVYERVAFNALVEASGTPSAAVLSVRGALCMESCCILMALPVMLKRPRQAFAFMLLAGPCVIALDAAGGQQIAGRVLAQYLEPGVQKLGLTVAVTCFMMVFMGGFLTMMFCLFIVQVMSKLHNLEKMKA